MPNCDGVLEQCSTLILQAEGHVLIFFHCARYYQPNKVKEKKINPSAREAMWASFVARHALVKLHCSAYICPTCTH